MVWVAEVGRRKRQQVPKVPVCQELDRDDNSPA
jgi:hypothetical protein